MNNTAQSPKNYLFIKILLFSSFMTFLPLVLFNIQTSGNYLYQTLFVALISLAIFSFFIYRLLNPLKKLYQAAILFSKGELNHRINLSSNDEIGSLAKILDQMAQNLSISQAKLIEDKELITTEKNKLMSIISSIGDGIVVVDIHKKVVLANKSAEDLIGFKLIEMENKLLNELFTLTDSKGQQIQTKDYCPINLPHDNQISHTPPLNLPSPLTLLSKNGQKSSVRLNSSPIENSLHSNLGCILILHDILKEKEFQEMQIDFVSMASHELRTPLTSIIGYINTVLEERGKMSEEQIKFLERAQASSQQLYALVDNILNVSKVERGAFSISRQPTDLNELITQIVENNKNQAVEKNIILDTELGSNLPQVLADKLRITEVLNNLIGNALKFTKAGGTIKVVTKLQGNEVLTQVTDTGAGIPESSISHLFTKFYRAPGSLDQMQQGTGLGLYISKNIIDLHHGKIWVQSALGKGTTFYFTLPITTTVQTQPTIANLHSFTLPN